MEEKKAYYAIIPATIRYDKDIKANAKLLYGEITALCNEKGYCWATNGYFAELYGVSKNTISVWINQLIKKGYLFSEIKYKNDTNEIDKRYLKLNEVPIIKKNDTPSNKNDATYNEKSGDPIQKNINTPITKNLKENNTITNNTINNTISKDIVCRTDKSAQPKNTPYDFIIELFNSTCKSLPKVKARNKTRDKYIKTMFRSLGADKVNELFCLVESSDYLSGRNGKWMNCSFDWVIKEGNYTKIFEGNYHRNQYKVIDINNKRNETSNQIQIDKSKLGGL